MFCTDDDILVDTDEYRHFGQRVFFDGFLMDINKYDIHYHGIVGDFGLDGKANYWSQFLF
jgi:hypothetical protein